MVTVKAPLCTLGEGPLWHSETQEFVFTDIVNGKLYAWKPQTGHCRMLLSCSYQLGAFLFDNTGDLLLFTEKGVFHCSYRQESRSLLPLFPMNLRNGERFNDAICTPDNKMIAGTKTEENENGCLYLFEKNKAPVLLISELKISNGMGFSSDGAVFYHTDSGRRTIYQYDYKNGTLSPPSSSGHKNCSGTRTACGPFGLPLWEDRSPDQAVPDGMTVDSHGNIWTAFWGRGCITCIDAKTQAKLEEHYFPAKQVSSLSFGGNDMNSLLITSAATGSDNPHDGETYCLAVSVTGKEEYRYTL